MPAAAPDRFVHDRLPPRDAWPDLACDLPHLQYAARLNCAAEILDKAVLERGWGERIALRGPSGTLRYRELLGLANRIAQTLTEDMGLVPGNRVLIHAANSALMAACWFAVVKAGGIAVTTMPLLRAGEIAEVAGKARVTHALCDAALRDELRRVQDDCPFFEHILPLENAAAGDPPGRQFAAKSGVFAAADTAADDVALIAFTSGTTGRPKGCVHFHREVMVITDAFPRDILHPLPDDIFVGISPLAFTFSLGGLLLFPLRYGASTVLGYRAAADELPRAIEEHRATVTFAVPTAYRMALDRIAGSDISSLRLGVSAGEPLPQATRDDWRRATGVELIDGIGSTEMLHIFIAAAGGDIRPGAIGKPVPGYRAAILDGAGRELPPGSVGRLAVKGPTGCRYLDDPRQADYVQNGWNLTGDAGLIDADGYFHYRSRTDDMIISAGNNIGGPEVEDVLLQHPAVAECAVIGVPSAERGQTIKAFVVLKSGHEGSPALVAALQEHVKARLAPYKYPRLVEFRRTLPRTGTGKLQRFKLREEAAPAASSPAATSAPITPHRILQPEGWVRPRGFANGIVAHGTYVSVAGQVGWDEERCFPSDNFTEQARQALRNVVAVVATAGGRPEHVARLTWYVTDKREYLAQSKELGTAYREVMGRHYPPMTVVQVAALVEDAAKVEIEATAVIPDA